MRHLLVLDNCHDLLFVVRSRFAVENTVNPSRQDRRADGETSADAICEGTAPIIAGD